MGDYLVYCSICGRIGRDLGPDEAAAKYVDHKSKTQHPDLFIRKELTIDD